MSDLLPMDARLPPLGGESYTKLLHVRLRDVYSAIARAVNASRRVELLAAPTTGLWKQGNFVWNSEPAEAGSAGSKYVVLGWVCVTSGEPGTWKAVRTLTGS